MQHLTGHQIATLAHFPNRSILHIGEVTFSSNFCFAETVSRFEQRLEIQELSLDIETGIETFDS